LCFIQVCNRYHTRSSSDSMYLSPFILDLWCNSLWMLSSRWWWALKVNTTITSVTNVRKGAGSPDCNLLKYWVFLRDVTAAILWCPKRMKRRPCSVGVPNQSCGTLTLFLCKQFYSVPIILHGCWPREWKRRIFVKNPSPNLRARPPTLLSHVACSCGLSLFLSSQRKKPTADVAFLSCLAVYFFALFIYFLLICMNKKDTLLM